MEGMRQLFYLFKNGKCESLCDDKERLEKLVTEDDKDAVIFENESWLNPSDLSVIDGKIQIREIVQTTTEIKSVELAALESEYKIKLDALKDSLATASLADDASTITELKTEYADLMKEYQGKLEAVSNG